MKYNFIAYIFGIVLLIACSNEEENRFVFFALDTESNTVEGSFVQGAELLPTCHAVICYTQANGGTAKFYSDEVNGLVITETELQMENGNGTVKVPVKGSPIALGMTYLPVYVEYLGTKYQTTVSVTIFEDSDPSGAIEFNIVTESLLNLNAEKVIDFTVNPTMTAITLGELSGMVTKVTQDLKTGKGTLTLSPAAEFLSGTIELTASFGARTPVVKSMSANVFGAGDGTSEAPYEIAEAIHLGKLNLGLDKYFVLTKDLSIEEAWTPVGSLDAGFSGGLDGGGHTVTYRIDTPNTSAVGFFGKISVNANVKNLNLSGEVTGNSVVGGFAAMSDAALTNCTANVEVKGQNILAAMVASGAKKDARVLTVGSDFPTLINIAAGTDALEVSLDILPKDVEVVVRSNTTGAKVTYDPGTGMVKADKSGIDFKKGEIVIAVKLGALVTLQEKSITIDSKKMFESGTGTDIDPYIVADGEQFIVTLSNHPNSSIALKNNIALTEKWTPVSAFSGNLDGRGYTVTGLVMENTTGFVGINTGVIHDLKFTGISVTTNKGPFGTIAGVNEGTIENVEVAGDITSTTATDVLGGIAGENQKQAIVNNCYVNANIVASCGMVGGVVGRNKGTNPGVKVTNCTTDGSITIAVSKTRIAGIVGRGEGPDLIKGCLSSMIIDANASGANGVGGIFGANNDNNMKIEECQFTGSVKSGNDVGGIAGVGVNIMNCLVENATIMNSVSGANGNAAGICGTNKMYAKYCMVRGTTIEGIVGIGKSISGINGNYQNNGTTASCIVENTTIKGGTVKRISAIDPTAVPTNKGEALQNNWTCNVTLLNGSGDDITSTAVDNAIGLDGGTIATVAMTQVWYESLGYDFTDVWTLTEGKLALRNVGYKQK